MCSMTYKKLQTCIIANYINKERYENHFFFLNKCLTLKAQTKEMRYAMCLPPTKTQHCPQWLKWYTWTRKVKWEGKISPQGMKVQIQNYLQILISNKERKLLYSIKRVTVRQDNHHKANNQNSWGSAHWNK